MGQTLKSLEISNLDHIQWIRSHRIILEANVIKGHDLFRTCATGYRVFYYGNVAGGYCTQ